MPDSSVPRRLYLHARLRLRGALGTALLLLLLTAVGGAMRFAALDRPTIWGDEAATWYRVVGTYRQLLGELQDTSFAPLHYQLYWWIGQGLPVWGEVTPAGTLPERPVPDAAGRVIATEPARALRGFEPAHPLLPDLRLTPHVMRAVPAISGTLMIGAMFFLARQMFGVRVSLLAAALTCFSAYLLVYSRDAKMYMHFWLMCTLHAGCLLWWLRTRTLTAWLCWVAAGVAMIGLHKLGDFLIAVDVLIFIAAPRQHWFSIVRLVGLIGWAIAFVFVAPFKLFRSPLPVRRERVRERAESDPIAIAQSTEPSPQPSPGLPGEGTGGGTRFDRFFTWPVGVWHKFAFPPVLLFLPGLLLISRSTAAYFDDFNQRTDRVLREDGTIDMGANGTGWVDAYNDGRELGDYLLYTAGAYLTGWEWPHAESRGFTAGDPVDPRTRKLHQWAVVALIGGLAVGGVPWRTIFATRRSRRRLRLHERPLSSAMASRRLWWIAAWICVPAYVLYTQSITDLTTPADGVSRLLLKTPPDMQWPRLPTLPKIDEHTPATVERPTYFGKAVWEPFREAQHAAWQTYRNAFTRDNIDVAACVTLAGVAILVILAVAWRRRATGWSAINALIVVIALFAVFTLLAWVPRRTNGSAWMPRYAAVILPAVLIAAAALIARLPGWPTRAAFVGLFAVINLWQFSARVFTSSESPIDRIARDVIDAQPREVIAHQPQSVPLRTYVQLAGTGGGEPGRGSLESTRGAYYLWLYSHLPVTPREILHRGFIDRFRIWRVASPMDIDNDLARSPHVTRVVVWSSLRAGKTDQTDVVADRIGKRFKRTRDEIIPVYDHWMWTNVYTLRRREYVKKPDADLPPATRPAKK